MAQTLASLTTLLCPVTEFLKRVDPSVIGKLASDTPGVPVPTANLPNDPNVNAALQDAGGIVESAISVGGRYTMDDIAAILAAPTSNACGMLYRLVSDIAWACMFERRPNKEIPTPPSMERSLAWLDMLSDGQRIFPFLESEDAGVAKRVEASVEDVEERFGAAVQARPLFGQRSDERSRRW